MIVLDYIIMNRDRHGANIEVLNGYKKIDMASYFDNGLSFVCTITQDLKDYKHRVTAVDPFQDNPVNNYIGTRSLFNNLDLISQPIELNTLKIEHKKKIFYGMQSYIDKAYIDKIWQIITYRYSFLRKRGLIIVD